VEGRGEKKKSDYALSEISDVRCEGERLSFIHHESKCEYDGRTAVGGVTGCAVAGGAVSKHALTLEFEEAMCY
jgi:hypothetical protein